MFRCCTNTELKKEGVCSESAKTKFVKPESLMWESCIVQDHTNTSRASRCTPERRSEGLGVGRARSEELWVGR